MMRPGSKLLLAALVTACLAGLLAWLGGGSPAEAPAPEAEAAPGYWMLYERELPQFRSLTVTLASGEQYAVRSDLVYREGTLLGVQNSLGQPVVVVDQPDFALDTSAWQMMQLLAQHIPVTARYEALDRDACGLASPAARLEIAYEDGTSLELSLGNLTASGTSCYVSLAGDSAVYLAPYDLHEIMTRTLKEQHALPGALNRDASDAVQIAVDGLADGRIIATRYGGDRLLPWQVDTPIVHDGSTERIEAFLSGLCALHADAYAATARSAEDLAAYGLDEPLRLVAAFSDGEIRDVQVGADAGDGMVYARLDSTGDIYLLRRDQLDFAANANLEGLLDRFVALIPLGEVQALTVTLPQASYALTQDWSAADEAVAAGYACNGAALSQEEFSRRYAAVIGLQFDRVAPQDAAEGEPLALLDFTLRDGTRRLTALFSYDTFYTLAVTDGGGRFLVRNTRVDAMTDALKEDAHAAQ